MAAAGTTGSDLWQKAISQLHPDIQANLNLVRSGRNDIVSAALQTVEEKRQLSYKRRWKVKVKPGGDEIVIRDVLEKTSAWIRRFREIGDVAVQYDPAHASLPWAAVRFLLQASINDTELHGSIVEDLELITRLLARFREFEKLHSAGSSSLWPEIEDALAGLYALTLECLGSHVRYFKEPTIKHIAKAPFRSVDQSFGERIRTREAEVLKLASLDDTARSLAIESSLVRLCDLALVSEKELEEAQFFELLTWLSPIPFMRAHDNVKRGRIAGTGEWILQHPTYVSWKSTSSSSMLLLHGVRGCGKTNLCSMVVDALLNEKLQNPLSAPIAYFYCADLESERDRRNPNDVFRSIVRQLTMTTTPQRSAHASVATCYERMMAQAKIEGVPSNVTNLGISECLDLILESLGNNPATIVIDALDEVSIDTRYDMLETLNQIVRRSANVVKILLTSRNDSSIFETLKDAQRLRVTRHEVGTDLESYARLSVDAAVTERRLLNGDCTKELKERLVSELVAGASEMFIWVKMHLSRLCRLASEQDIVLALADKFTSTLDELYASAFQSIKNSGEVAWTTTMRIFSWLLYMQEPLSVDDLITVIGAQRGQTLLTPEGLIRLCSNIVILEDMQLRFSHHSAQEFLRAQPELIPTLGHRMLLSDSLSVCIEGPPATLSSTVQQACCSEASYRYAAIYWLWHLERADIRSFDEDLCQQATDFVFDEDDPSLHFAMWLESLKNLIESLPNNHPLKPDLSAALSPSSSPLFALSIFGLSSLVAHHPWSTAFDWNQRNDFGHTALYLACCSGNESLVQFLITMGAEINVECGKHGSPLHVACFHGHRSVVALLLSYNVDMKTGNVYKSAIDAALRGDHEDMALILLKDPLAVSSQDMHDDILATATQAGSSAVIELLQTTSPFEKRVCDRHSRMAIKAITSGKISSLSFLLRNAGNASEVLPSHSVAIAAAYGHREVVEFLLDAGLDIETPGPVGPPLRSAALVGHEPTARALIDRGADVNANDFHGNPLHAAAMKGNTHVVKLLLSAGAKVNLPGDFYGNALQAAAFRGHKDVVEIFLGAGVNVYASGYTKDAFHAASAGGHEHIVMLLIDHGYTFRWPIPTMARSRASMGPARAPRKPHVPPSADTHEILLEMAKPEALDNAPFSDQHRPEMSDYASSESPNFALEAAAAGGHLAVVQRILDSGDILALGGRQGTSIGGALRQAIAKGHFEIADLILRSPWVTNYQLDGELEIAAASGSLPLVEVIIRHFAKRDVRRRSIEYALRSACSKSHTVVLRLSDLWNELWPGLGLQAAFPWMLTTAAAAVNLETMEFVLNRWEHPSEKALKRSFHATCSWPNANGLLSIRKAMDSSQIVPPLVTASMLAVAANCHSDVMVHVLALLGPYLSDEILFKSIFQASEDGHLENVKLLLQHGERSNVVHTTVKTKALLVACMADRFAVCEYLIQHGADVNSVVRFPTVRSCSSFQEPRAPTLGNPWPWEEHDAQSEDEQLYAVSPGLSYHIARELRRDHSHPSRDGGNDFTALQACLEGLKRDQQWQWDYEFYSDLQKCCASREKLLAYLIDHGADMNEIGGATDYPLGIAAGVCSAQFVSWMIDKGADLKLRKGFQTALDAAVGKKRDALAIVKALFCAGGSSAATTDDLERVIKSALEALPSSLEDTMAVHTSLFEGPGAIVCFLLERDPNLLATGTEFGRLLELAACAGDLSCIRLLINRGVDVDEACDHFGTALIAAAHFGHASVVKTLLNAGADPNNMGGPYQTALRAAASSGHIEVARVLADCSRTLIDLTSNEEPWDFTYIRGLPPLSEPRGPQQLSPEKHGEAVLDDLTQQPCNLPEGDGGCTLDDVSRDRRNISWENSKSSQDDTEDVPPEKWKRRDRTPLQLAIKDRHPELALLLLQAGAEVDLSRPNMQQSLIETCAFGSVELFEALISRDGFVRDHLKDCVDLLLEAIKHDQEDMVHCLLRLGLGSAYTSDQVRELDSFVPGIPHSRGFLPAASLADKDPLVCAAGRGNYQIVQGILGACQDRKSRWLGLALCEAAKMGKDTIVKLLLDHGACVIDPGSKFNAVACAGSKNHLSTMELLLDSLSDTAIKDACADAAALVGRGCDSAVILMSKYTNCTSDVLVAACFWNREQIVLTGLDQGVDPNTESKKGFLPLHAAAHCGNLEILNQLLLHGADVNSQCRTLGPIIRSTLEGLAAPSLSASGRSADCRSLSRDAPWDHPDWLSERSNQPRKEKYEKVVRMLLDHGAPINLDVGHFGSVLHLAAFVGSREIFERVLANGSSIESRGGCFDTVLAFAIEGGNDDVIEVVLECYRASRAKPEDYNMPLLSACRLRNSKAIRSLLLMGADPNCADTSGKTPLSTVLLSDNSTDLLEKIWAADEDSVLGILLDHSSGVRLSQNDLTAAVCSKHIFDGHVLQRLLEYDPGITVNEELMIAVLKKKGPYNYDDCLDFIFNTRRLDTVTDAMVSAVSKARILRSLLDYTSDLEINTEMLKSAGSRSCVRALLDRAPDLLPYENILEKVLISKSPFEFDDTEESTHVIDVICERNPELIITEKTLTLAKDKDDLERLLKHARPENCPLTKEVLTDVAKPYWFHEFMSLYLEFNKSALIPSDLAVQILLQERPRLLLEMLLLHDPGLEITEDMFLAVFENHLYRHVHVRSTRNDELERLLKTLERFGKKVKRTSKISMALDREFRTKGMAEMKRRYDAVLDD